MLTKEKGAADCRPDSVTLMLDFVARNGMIANRRDLMVSPAGFEPATY